MTSSGRASQRRTSGASRSGSDRVTLAAMQCELRAMEMAAVIDEIRQLETALTTLHLEDFPVDARSDPLTAIEVADGARLLRKGSAREVVRLGRSADPDLENLIQVLGRAQVDED